MSETDQPFTSPKLLIARAEENFADFEVRCNAFFATKVGSFVRDLDPKTGDHVIKFRIKEELPAGLRPVFSDGVNNLRHALDQAVNDSAIALRGGDANCYFPVARDAREFLTIFATKRYGKIPESIRPYLAQTQPYRGGNDLLWALSRMTGRNKHQVVLSLEPRVSGLGVQDLIIDSAVRFSLPVPRWDRAKKEMEIARMSPEAKVRGDLQVPVDVVLGAADVVGGQPALALSNEFLRMVEGVVLGLEAETARLLSERDDGHVAAAVGTRF